MKNEGRVVTFCRIRMIEKYVSSFRLLRHSSPAPVGLLCFLCIFSLLQHITRLSVPFAVQRCAMTILTDQLRSKVIFLLHASCVSGMGMSQSHYGPLHTRRHRISSTREGCSRENQVGFRAGRIRIPKKFTL